MDAVNAVVETAMARPAALDPTGLRAQELREKAREFVGLAFFAPLLKQATNTPFEGRYGHGGQGEKIFRGQLNQELAMRVGRSGKLRLDEAICRRMSRGVREADLQDSLDVTA
jgi:hypothetical protein